MVHITHYFYLVNRDIAETAGSTPADQRVNTLQHTATHCNTLQHTATDTLRIKIFVRFTAQCVAVCFNFVRFATSEHQMSRYRAFSREMSLLTCAAKLLDC